MGRERGSGMRKSCIPFSCAFNIFRLYWTTVGQLYTGNYFGDQYFEIQNEKNEVLRYNYKAHGFDPGDEAKKQLAIAIAQKYNGRWVEHQRDISQDRHASWVIDNYQVIAHEGLREMEEEKRKKDSIRKC